MGSFESRAQRVGHLSFPKFSGLRIMHMPFSTRHVRQSLNGIAEQYFDIVNTLVVWGAYKQADVAYVTIDEAVVEKGTNHRRPGLHVDGVGPDGRAGGWGGGGGWGANGMMTVSSSAGCVAYDLDVKGWPKANGDCEHLRDQMGEGRVLMPGDVYWFSPLTVHESIPAQETGPRQFVRVSAPSRCPWYEGYTRNPNGVQPMGPIHPARTEFMEYRP